jgi:hypothetical protein
LDLVYIVRNADYGNFLNPSLQKLDIFNQYRIDIVKFILMALFWYYFDINLILIQYWYDIEIKYYYFDITSILKWY